MPHPTWRPGCADATMVPWGGMSGCWGDVVAGWGGMPGWSAGGMPGWGDARMVRAVPPARLGGGARMVRAVPPARLPGCPGARLLGYPVGPGRLYCLAVVYAGFMLSVRALGCSDALVARMPCLRGGAVLRGVGMPGCTWCPVLLGCLGDRNWGLWRRGGVGMRGKGGQGRPPGCGAGGLSTRQGGMLRPHAGLQG